MAREEQRAFQQQRARQQNVEWVERQNARVQAASRRQQQQND